ncbi:MAG: cyclic dehypoxanthinyl futalosine synthase [Myxococcota bacterium]|jgi:cyclic dehypoxanthinyl futalosine synthase
MLDSIRRTVESGGRISREEAAWLYTEADDATLSDLATTVRDRFHPRDEATYLLMAIVNYTNVCVARCDYCSFYRLPGKPGGYLLNVDQVCAKISELVAHGGTLVGFNGGFHPKLRVWDYAGLFGRVHERFPELSFYEMTVAEFMYTCKVSSVTYAEGAQILAGSGTKWITGGGSEVLDDAFRLRHSPLKYTVEDYYTAQRAILDAGLGSTATMVIGFDETLDERMNHLERLRRFQDEVDHALPSFLCWTYKPWNNDLGGEEVSMQEYLRWLAISRIYLDNFVHIRTSVLTRNEGALQGLRYGADDFDLPTEDEVTQMAGATISHAFDQVLAAADAIGVRPQTRDAFPLRVPFEPRG